jgi:hypothetical protein
MSQLTKEIKPVLDNICDEPCITKNTINLITVWFKIQPIPL